MACLFCLADGPFTVEHIIPESLGNDDMVLHDDVCRSCNNHFSKIEEFVLKKTPLAFWRCYLGIKAKSGRLPSINLSQPNRERGIFAAIHPDHDNHIGFTAHEDGSTSIDIDNSEIINAIFSGEKSSFRFVFSPKVLIMLGRFLCKVGIELICSSDPVYARSDKFNDSRAFARHGSSKDLWPIFHFSHGDSNDFKRISSSAGDTAIESECYSYEMLEFKDEYILLKFTVGSDNWIICLNDRYPTPDIRKAFPGQELNCLWCHPDAMANKIRIRNRAEPPLLG